MKLEIPQRLRTTVTLAEIPDGVAGIRATLALMVKLAQLGKVNFAVRNKALGLVRGLAQKDYFSEVKAIHEYVRDSIRYVRDIEGVETVAAPDKTLLSLQGDCDDKSLLVAALLLSIGHPVRFVAVGDSPNNFVHVLPETKIALKWWPVETTEPVPVGWYPQGYPYRMVYTI
jgi:predicted transglutaminase-like cysteine proteinase